MALSQEDAECNSVRTSQATKITALLEPPTSSSASAKSSDEFFTPDQCKLRSCCDTDEDGHAAEDGNAEDACRSLSSDSTVPHALVYVQSKTEIEASKVHWTGRSISAIEEELETESLSEKSEIFQRLQEEWGDHFFMDFRDQFTMGQKIAEGGQAEIFQVISLKSNKISVLKLFKKGSSVRNLQNQFPQGMLQTSSSKHGGPSFKRDYSVNIFGAMLYEGRFAFWMERLWGDLRKLIEIKKEKNPIRGSIFTDSRVFHNMLEIADGMKHLHNDGILHRDLKASNVLIRPFESQFDPISGYFSCMVSDYECSVGVVGTGFWRAPEILSRLKGDVDYSSICTRKSDVYSYGMTCYEILTGSIPFHDSPKSDYESVCSGRRPKLPSDIKPWIKRLLNRCWHQDPSRRPTFQGIIDTLCKNHKLDSHVQQS